MAPLGLGGGFYGLGPTINSDNAAVLQDFGEACRFNGSDVNQERCPGYIDIDNDFQATIRASFTVSFWAKHKDGRDTDGGANQHYFSIGIGNTTLASANDEFSILSTYEGKLQIIFRANSDPHWNLTDAAHIADGQGDWQHIAVTVTKNSSGNTTSIIYVDGVAVDTSIVSSREITDSNQETFEGHANVKTTLGATRDSASSGTDSFMALDGDMKEVALWNVALDAAAIAKIEDLSYVNPNLLVDDGDYDVSGNLVGYWKLNDYSGLTAVDSKGSNDGTIKSSSVFGPSGFTTADGIDLPPFFV